MGIYGYCRRTRALLDLSTLIHGVGWCRAETLGLIWALVSPLYLIHRPCMDIMKPSKCLRRFNLPADISHTSQRFLSLYYSLAIGRMFGGIPRSFFEEYHKQMPKTEPVDQYELRGDLYELFHYLNHTVLFGVSNQLVR